MAKMIIINGDTMAMIMANAPEIAPIPESDITSSLPGYFPLRMVGQQAGESGCIISKTGLSARKCNQSGRERVILSAEAQLPDERHNQRRKQPGRSYERCARAGRRCAGFRGNCAPLAGAADQHGLALHPLSTTCGGNGPGGL